MRELGPRRLLIPRRNFQQVATTTVPLPQYPLSVACTPPRKNELERLEALCRESRECPGMELSSDVGSCLHRLCGRNRTRNHVKRKYQP